ncbi:hypothetical protein [Streptomyces sp. NPDC051173]|uniref:hypothetical protein n=1 Tax=Streptomyces sp. NPDC051173 TaxID=3155164 RepID=UPI0034507A2B
MRMRSDWLSRTATAFAILIALLAVAPVDAFADPKPKVATSLAECIQLWKDKQSKSEAAKPCGAISRKECGDNPGKWKGKECTEFLSLTVGRKIPESGEKCGGHGDPDIMGGVCDAAKKVEDVVKDPVGTIATAAFDAVSGNFGKAATEILNGLTDVFLKVSVIDLNNKGLLNVYSMTWALSSLVALLLMIWQFAKAGYSGEGVAAATAIAGLAKWAVTTLASLAVTQAALGAAHEISVWMIDQYRDGGGEKAFKDSLNHAFNFDGITNTALVLLLAILAALVSLVLWGEMLLRQAAIQVLVACMPIVGTGGIMQATKEWFPKARSALIALILIEPVVVLIFVIGFSTTGQAKGLKDMLVGLLTLVLAAVAWPTLAKFMTFTSVGAGGSLASGLLGAAGGTAASLFGSGGGTPSGAGAVGNGRSFTQAVEAENDGAVAQDGAAGRARAGGMASGLAGMGKLGAAAMALQVAKAGKELTEGSMEAMAAHADLGPGKDMGGHISIPPRSGEPPAGPAPADDTGGGGAAPPSPPPGGPADRSGPPPSAPLDSAEPPPAPSPRGEAPAEASAAQSDPVDMSWPSTPPAARTDMSRPSEPAQPQDVDMSWPSAPAAPPPPKQGPGESGGTT